MASVNATGSNSEFNPFNQTVIIHDRNGDPIEVWLPRADVFVQYCIRICINYSAQLGASIALFVVLVLLTQASKRFSSVYVLNGLALVLNIIRLVCQIIYFTTDFTELYRFFAQDYRGIPAGAYAASVIGVVVVFLVLVCVLSSLVLQVQVVCSTLRIRYRRLLLVTSVLVALVPLGLRLAYVVLISELIVKALPSYRVQWLESATNIALTVNICFFCVIFVAKLGYAIKERMRLGVREFGPMKAIFIMGCQTMFIPGRNLSIRARRVRR
jgi:pheromone alpha factor receptor